MRNIAIIPARSGSKGLVNKNIKLLNGKPLIAYTIEAAEKSGVFDMIFLSTDSEEYAEIGRSFGAEVPFLRHDALASDSASTWDTVEEVLLGLRNAGNNFDTFMVLQPTSPLRTSKDIKESYRLFYEKNANGVVSVCEMDHSPLWCNKLPKDGNLENFIDQAGEKRRQELDTYYRINGAIYLLRVSTFLKQSEIYSNKCFAYIMSKKNSIDIDTLLDFEMAEFLLNKV